MSVPKGVGVAEAETEAVTEVKDPSSPLVSISDTDLVTRLKELELWIQSQKVCTLEIEAGKKICLRQLVMTCGVTYSLSTHLDAISDQ